MKIGIVCQDQPDNRFGVQTNYIHFVAEFGTPILILPAKQEEFLDTYNLDALLLPGGADVNPIRYKKIMYNVGGNNPYLEYFDGNILPMLVGNIPIFGICRGLQTLNVHFGGTLKNLFWHPVSTSEEHLVHKIYMGTKKTKELYGVNSFHHQAIDIKAENLKIEAMSEDGTVIEAVSDYEKKIFAVQWHPERLKDGYSLDKFQTILS